MITMDAWMVDFMLLNGFWLGPFLIQHQPVGIHSFNSKEMHYFGVFLCSCMIATKQKLSFFFSPLAPVSIGACETPTARARVQGPLLWQFCSGFVGVGLTFHKLTKTSSSVAQLKAEESQKSRTDGAMFV